MAKRTTTTATASTATASTTPSLDDVLAQLAALSAQVAAAQAQNAKLEAELAAANAAKPRARDDASQTWRARIRAMKTVRELLAEGEAETLLHRTATQALRGLYAIGERHGWHDTKALDAKAAERAKGTGKEPFAWAKVFRVWDALGTCDADLLAKISVCATAREMLRTLEAWESAKSRATGYVPPVVAKAAAIRRAEADARRDMLRA